jgi:hypothetical protein
VVQLPVHHTRVTTQPLALLRSSALSSSSVSVVGPLLSAFTVCSSFVGVARVPRPSVSKSASSVPQGRLSPPRGLPVGHSQDARPCGTRPHGPLSRSCSRPTVPCPLPVLSYTLCSFVVPRPTPSCARSCLFPLSCRVRGRLSRATRLVAPPTLFVARSTVPSTRATAPLAAP